MKILNNIPIMRTSILVLLVFISVNSLKAQDDKIKFSALARAMQLNNKLEKADTLNSDNTSRGNVLLDLGININPDKKTEIQAIVRFNNNIGGFYGADAAASLRQLSVKGTLGNFLNYQVGDLYLQLTPYTFFNNNSEGSINEATIFKDIRKDYTNYENFSNKGNAWWQQGVHSNMSLAVNGFYFDTARFDVFFLRNRSTNFSGVPNTFHAGGKTTFTRSNKMKIAFNYLDLFDIDYSDKNKNLKRNPVSSAEINASILENDKMKLSFMGETGLSNQIDSSGNVQGFFYDAGLKVKIKKSNLQFGANYTYVDPYFYSAAAQSKRVNYGATPFNFAVIGNNPYIKQTRTSAIYDLVSDASIYNTSIVRTLMPFNFIMGNAQPYGKATPNRTGIELNSQYKDSAQKISFDINAAYLSNIVGEGTEELRHFTVLKSSLTLDVSKILNSKKQLLFTSGYSYEATNRGGSELEKIDLKNNLIDLGLTIETMSKLDLLVGYKILNSKGNEFVALRDDANKIVNFIKYENIAISQNIMSFGLKYRFSSASYLMLQNSTSTSKFNSSNITDYQYNQFMILFNMNF